MRLLLIALLAVASTAFAQTTNHLLGFSTSGAAAEREVEGKFDKLLRAENLRAWMQKITSRPHHTGSAGSKETAEFIAKQFKSWGYETKIERFEILFPQPKKRLLEMTSPEKYRAKLSEGELKGDRTSGITKDQLPPFHAFSIDGDVTGQLVYVNYGIPADYERLNQMGIEVRDKIVIARYGGSWRGIKPKVAAEHGAIGCILYSDPRDDGYFAGDVYPKGAWRNEQSVQRGSVMDVPIYCGDPSTPGYGSTNGAPHLPLSEIKILTKIPVLPISYADALPLLKALEGPVAPEDWRGALPMTYHVGPGPAKVHLALEFNWKLVPIFDVIAMIRGDERPDEWVMRANHHDAWNFGADDPVSGLVAVMEEARAIGELVKQGWRPKRSLVYAAWDAEEQGLIGSTEWVETHAELLTRNVVAYINTDNNGRGPLRVGGSHVLEELVNQAALAVPDIEKPYSVAERARAANILGESGQQKLELMRRADFKISALGSGSDYTPFLQHLGIAAMDIRFRPEEGGGSYHSIYDSFDHYTRFIDPNFEYGLVLARTAGRVMLRLANAEVVPFQFTRFATTLRQYAREVSALQENRRKETDEFNQLLAGNIFDKSTWSTNRHLNLKAKPVPATVLLEELFEAITTVETSALRCDRALAVLAKKHPLSSREARDLDQLIYSSERTLLLPNGLPNRPWYKHAIYAPGLYTGYGVKTFPGVREAFEQGNSVEATAEVELLIRALRRYVRQLDEIIDRAETAVK